MRRPFHGVTGGYVLALVLALTIALTAGWSSLAERMDGDAYDWMVRVHPPPARPPHSVVAAFDEQTLSATGGIRNIRPMLAKTLEVIATAQPKVVAIDITAPDASPGDIDASLARAFSRTPNLILPANLNRVGEAWEDPAREFRKFAVAIAHVHAAPDPVSRVLPLEVTAGRIRRWAVALEAARIFVGAQNIIESPKDLRMGGITIPASRATGRAMYIQYCESVPEISIARLLSDKDAAQQLRGKAVFIGVTDQTATRDRLMTPMGTMMSGVEMHAQAFETLLGGSFPRPLPDSALVLLCLGFTVGAGLTFSLLSGWPAYIVAALVLAIAHSTPHLAFRQGVIVPYLSPIWSAWLAIVTAAAWQYFIVRRQLRQSESDKARYQQAIHFVSHEMRSPLTAIQGSSELMGRYNLNDEKRKQMAQMINAESKRLSRIIQTFLDVERLTDGQMELRSELFEMGDVLRPCIERARPLAELKEMEMRVGEVAGGTMKGDRELIEYAVYNLLTNAVKYSNANTTVTISAVRDAGTLRLAVRDQGIGIEEKDLRNIFKKFYRTKKAEASGETGTGIGLSIVEQIVIHHGGRMEVTSEPGHGSCFTMVVPVRASTLVTQ